MSARRKAIVTLGVGVVLLLAIGAATLAQAPPRVAREGTKQQAPVLVSAATTDVCQAGETLPAGVSAVRLAVWAFFGTPVHVTISSGSRVLTEGRRGPAWTGSSVTVPVRSLRQSASPVTVCAHFGPNSQPLYLMGREASPAESATARGRPLGGRIGIEYLAAGEGSWWSRIEQVARHMGIGRAMTGTWIVLLIFALMVAVGTLSIRVALRELS